MDTLYLEKRVHGLELKIIELESKLLRTTSDAHRELTDHQSPI